MRDFFAASMCVKGRVEEGEARVSARLNEFPGCYERKMGENGRGEREVSRRKGEKRMVSGRERI